MTNQWLSGVGSGGKDGLQGPEGNFRDANVHYLDHSEGFSDVYVHQKLSNGHSQYAQLIYAKLYIIKSIKKCFRFLLYIFKCFLFLSAFATCILGQSTPIILLSIVDICSSCSVVMLLRWPISLVRELVFPWALGSSAEQCSGEGLRIRLRPRFFSLGLRERRDEPQVTEAQAPHNHS